KSRSVFFFSSRRRHTRSLRDWSSDVCSSDLPGMVEAMTQVAHGAGRPFLGICVGMQLLASRGLEYTTTPGLGWIPGDVGPIRPRSEERRVGKEWGSGWSAIQSEKENLK